jgi:hypothetical protein
MTRQSRPTEEELRLFATFWETYPRGRMGRRDRAQRAFLQKLREGTPAEVMVEGARRYGVHCRYDVHVRGDTAFQYMLHANNFLAHERYLEVWPAPFDPDEKVDLSDPFQAAKYQ